MFNHSLDVSAEIREIFSLVFFGRIEDNKISCWNCLTFSTLYLQLWSKVENKPLPPLLIDLAGHRCSINGKKKPLCWWAVFLKGGRLVLITFWVTFICYIYPFFLERSPYFFFHISFQNYQKCQQKSQNSGFESHFTIKLRFCEKATKLYESPP